MARLPCQRRAASSQDAHAAHRFRAFAPEADIDLRDISSFAPELAAIPPGLEWLRVASERFFIDRIAPQHESLQVVLREFPADVIVGDNAMFGVLPMLLGPRAQRPPVILCGTFFLHWSRDDGERRTSSGCRLRLARPTGKVTRPSPRTTTGRSINP
jgi:hypothetical protein